MNNFTNLIRRNKPNSTSGKNMPYDENHEMIIDQYVEKLAKSREPTRRV